MIEAYSAIDCATHSQYELLAMHQSRVLLEGIDAQGNSQKFECRVKDIQTYQKAEYLVAINNNTAYKFRLDQIVSISELFPR